MGQICSKYTSDTESDGSFRNQSIFVDLKEERKLKKRYEYAHEYKIGAYFQNYGGGSESDSSMVEQKQKNEKNYSDDEIRVKKVVSKKQKRDKKKRELTKQEKKNIEEWEKLHFKSNEKYRESEKKKRQNNNQDQNEDDQITNQFILDKIDKMLLNCQKMNTDEFVNKMRKQGPPPALRWGSWKANLQWNTIYETGLYERLLENLQQGDNYEQIQRDIIRTYGGETYFSHAQEQGKSLGHEQLLRVLCAISNYFPDVGYCQGMNFILGLFIMVSGGNEIDVFWSFISLVRKSEFLMIGLYEEKMPLLLFLQYVTEKTMEKNIPEIYETLMQQNVPSSFYMSKWHMTLFLYSFPIPICLRIWDYFLTEGIFGLVSIVIPILRVFENYIKGREQMEIMEFLQQIGKHENDLLDPKSELYLNMDQIIEEACQIKKLDRKQIQQYAFEYTENDPYNEYVQLYTFYNDQEEFQRKVDDFIAPKIYTHFSRSQSMNQTTTNDGSERKDTISTQANYIEENMVQNNNNSQQLQLNNNNYEEEKDQQDIKFNNQHIINNNEYSQQQNLLLDKESNLFNSQYSNNKQQQHQQNSNENLEKPEKNDR